MNEPATQVDMLTLARFAVLPGAARVLEAYAKIPPGKLRDTFILQVEALAEQYDAAPAAFRAPDPLAGALNGAGVGAAALPPPRPPPTPHSPMKMGRKVPPMGPEMQAVDLRMQGHNPVEIAERLAVEIETVAAWLADARAAGVKLPRLPKGKGRAYTKGTRFPLFETELTSSAMISALQHAAHRRGIKLGEYLARRRKAVAMAQQEPPATAAEIIAATGESDQTISNWLTTARAAGLKVPYLTFVRVAEFEDAPKRMKAARKPKPKPRSQTRFALTWDEATRIGQHMIRNQAAKLGMDVEDYLSLRRRAVAMFQEGRTPAAVSAQLGMTHTTASNWHDRARDTGLLTISPQPAT